jgi:C4-dicarboxylate transporter DctM subunit
VTVSVALLGSFAGCLLLNFPIAIALGLAGLTCILAFGLAPPTFFPQTVAAALDSYTLLTIPLFILAGSILGRAGIARRLVEFAHALFGPLPGGLAIATIVTGIFLAGISGSGTADIAAMGFLIGVMAQAGYPRELAVAVVAASGALGVVIPPSINLILYGVLTDTPIPALFFAGIIPGLLIGVLMIGYVHWLSRRHGYRGTDERPTLRGVGRALRRAVWGLVAPAVILGGIYGGVFTPTEAAGVAVVYALAVDLLVYREMRYGDLPGLLAEAGRVTGSVMLIIAGAALFSWVIIIEGVAEQIAGGVLAVAGGNALLVLLLVNVVLLVAGALMDAISAIFVFVPILAPVVKAAGVDPVHFGALVTVNLAMGHLTPPIGVGLYLAASIGGVPFHRAVVAALPLFLIELGVLTLVALVPELATWLPRAILGR